MSGKVLCCTILSGAGVIFLPIIGILIHTQPLFVHGLHHSESHTAAENGCYIAGGIYGAIFCACIYWMRQQQSKAHAQQYKVENLYEDSGFIQNSAASLSNPIQTPSGSRSEVSAVMQSNVSYRHHQSM